METKFRINLDLYAKVIASKHNGSAMNKTMYAKKLGLLSYHSRDVVIEVSLTEQEAQERVTKILNDFFSDESERELNKYKINYLKDVLKHEFLITCNKDLFIEKTNVKLIEEKNFDELTTHYTDDNNIPLRINFEHLGKVLEERNRRAKGDDSILNQKYKVQKPKPIYKKILTTIVNIFPLINFQP